ncbi:DUF423 domain-containing protein [Rhizobiaceae bacterium n13]|uniref:DUF423 domain-containing protein n=1 Tax=Ferirhizobium litorale TaxID=2927786 RepID=A0AAE3Q9L8_9HYPH|nr:DUF423 domain-containing protein [Fererhizobium litorale]MDI7860712.1 DUF423 domain-containing protein [Fererhizobium litorale]MDI7920860.1 DUF423 domain-containing protein [Fererhizobium litorale]
MSQSPRLQALILLLAGITGGSGVAFAAAASHGADAYLLGNAAKICLAHGPALLALYAGYASIRTAAAAGLLLGLGTLLFAADLLSRHFSGGGLLPMAAPTGGMAMIAGWLLIAAGALFRGRQD